jgi:hypothetical protein
MAMSPEAGPAAAGVKVTWIVHEVEGGRLAPQLLV